MLQQDAYKKSVYLIFTYKKYKINMLEIACFEITSAETALRSVADRIEFCSDQHLGGLTPDIEEFRYLKSVYRKPIYVMIRPVGGGFMYSESEFRLMQKSILEFKHAGADGFVFGILSNGNTIDMERNSVLIELAGQVPCTFHRAIDRTQNLETAVQNLIKLGFRAVLTSGGKATAWEGREHLKDLIASYSHRLDILVGGGVRSGNIAELKEFTGGRHFHSSAIPQYESFANEEEIRKLQMVIRPAH